MKISRIILRKMIIREVRNILTNPERLYESDFISKLTSGKNVDSVMKTVQSLGSDLDSIVLDSIRANKNKIAPAVERLDDEKMSLLINVVGQLRGALRPSTFQKLVKEMGISEEF